MSPPHTDFLLVGQGIAGSILAVSLLQLGYTVRVIDNHHHGSASRVAAGIINPVTGHRLNITDQFEAYIAAAAPFYKALEKQLGGNFYRTIKQRRLIKNAGQASFFAQRLEQPEYHGVLRRAAESPFLDSTHGCAEVANTAVVDTVALLDAVKYQLKTLGVYHSEQLDYQKLLITEQACGYAEWRASKLIFCEGYQAINNPWLKDLPFKLAKGEIVTVKTMQSNAHMLSWGNWLVPSKADQHTAKLGANYAWNDLALNPDPLVSAKLLQSFAEHTGQHAEILHHDVGIRPTTVQRQPFVGPLSNLTNAYCFNGFGSKGCLTIPYYAALLCEHFKHNKTLPDEIARWL